MKRPPDNGTAPGDETTIGHICERIHSGTVRTTPFPHLIVDSVLPDELFATLVDDIPPPERFLPVEAAGWASVAGYKHHRTALVNELDGANPKVLGAAGTALSDRRVETCLIEALAPVAEVQTLARRPLRRDVRLDCALAGAHLHPHTDAPILFMKALIYLSCAGPDSSLDTVLYSPKHPEARLGRFGLTGDYTDDTYSHERPEDHVEAGRVEFQANRLFAFMRSLHSLHGLMPLAASAAPRYLISVHFKHVH